MQLLHCFDVHSGRRKLVPAPSSRTCACWRAVRLHSRYPRYCCTIFIHACSFHFLEIRIIHSMSILINMGTFALSNPTSYISLSCFIAEINNASNFQCFSFMHQCPQFESDFKNVITSKNL